jgi:hypothetical protein
MGLLIIAVTAKSTYNSACVKFAEYILSNKKKEAEHKSVEAERLKEIQNMKTAAAYERDNAVAAALEQGRSEGAQAVAAHFAQQQSVQHRSAQPQPPSEPHVETYASTNQAYWQNIAPNEEVLYNQYGEPVMIRRRVKKQCSQGGETLYDRYGNPVMRRAESSAEFTATAVPTVSAPAVAPAPEPSVAPIPSPVSIPKPMVNQITTPPPVPTAFPKSVATEPAPAPESKPAPVTISTTNYQGSSSAVTNDPNSASQYQISWQPQSASADNFSNADGDGNSPKPINLNPYKG